MANTLRMLVEIAIGALIFGVLGLVAVNTYQTGSLVSATSATSTIWGLFPVIIVIAGMLVLLGVAYSVLGHKG